MEIMELLDCPLCGGTGILETEGGWCSYAACCDCGGRTAEMRFDTPEEHLTALAKAASLWNMGKVIPCTPGE